MENLNEIFRIRNENINLRRDKHGRVAVICKNVYGDREYYLLMHWTQEMMENDLDVNSDGSINYLIERL